jgi:hypothetical protein
LRTFFTIALIGGGFFARAQKIESIYVNLYTDSLKKGTFNYINIDGKLSNGKYIPLDSTHIIFWASGGKFSGNSLWIDKDSHEEKINIRATLRKDPTMFKEFVIYIKKSPDPQLKTLDELMNGLPKQIPKRTKG